MSPKLAVFGALLCLLLCITGTQAQVSGFGMIKQCPEGCRDIDKTTSCGDVAATTRCNMAVNGDVTMQCSNGYTYVLDVNGCQTQHNNTGTPFSQEWLVSKSQELADKTNQFYVDHLEVMAVVQSFLWFYFTFVGYRLRRLTGIFFGSIVGIFLGGTVAIFAGDDGTTYTLVAMCVCWLCMAGITALGVRPAGPIVGIANGGVVAVSLMEFEMHFENTEMGVAVPIIVAVGVLTGMLHGSKFPKPAIIFACVFFSFVCAIDAISVFMYDNTLFRAAKGDSAKLTVPLIVGAATAVVSVLMNLFWRRKMRKVGMDEDVYERLDPNEDRKQNWAARGDNGRNTSARQSGYGATERI